MSGYLELSIGPHALLLAGGGVREVWMEPAWTGQEALPWRGKRLPVIEGRDLFGLPPRDETAAACIVHEESGSVAILVADAVGRLVTLGADRFVPLPPLPAAAGRLLDGAATLDGRLVLRLRAEALQVREVAHA